MDKRIERMIERAKRAHAKERMNTLLKFLSMNQNQEHLYGK